MEPRRRRKVLALAGLGAVLLSIAAYQWRRVPAGVSATTSNEVRPRAAAAAPTATPSSGAAVELNALRLPRPEPLAGQRNPFRFQPNAPPPPAPAPPRPPGPAPVAGLPGPGAGTPSAPSAPAPPPPIPLKFIGVVESGGAAGKMAVLTDGRNVFHGREGDIIEGRYRIVRIGVEAVELMYLDGRGRQTIRLTG